jgi:hypothetical protein
MDASLWLAVGLLLAVVRKHSGRNCGKRRDVVRASTRMLAHLG